MWLFTPYGFYSAVQHNENPNKVMVRMRTKLHAERLVGFCPEEDKPEILETPPPRDYRFRVALDKKTWTYLVAKFASSIDYPNFKSRCALEKQPAGYMNSLHDVWDSLYRVQLQNLPNSGGRYSSTLGIPTMATTVFEETELLEGMYVEVKGNESMGEGEVVSVDETRKTALVHFIIPREGEEMPDEDVIRFPISDLTITYDPYEHGFVDEFEDGSSLDPTEAPHVCHSIEEYSKLDDGSWPPPVFDPLGAKK